MEAVSGYVIIDATGRDEFFHRPPSYRVAKYGSNYAVLEYRGRGLLDFTLGQRTEEERVVVEFTDWESAEDFCRWLEAEFKLHAVKIGN